MTVGKTVDKHLSALITDYAARISHYLPFAIETVPDIKNTKSLTPDQQKEREADAIERNLHDGDHLILLDEHGREFRSIEFAQYLEKSLHRSTRRIVFLIGGPYGFSERIYQRAQDKLSLSKLTFSHQMVRLFFTEQVYRAMTILRGEPYHHE